MLVKELDRDEFARQAWDDLNAAIETRVELETRKMRVTELYEAWATKVKGGGKLGETEGGRGEFGWSKLSVPLLFWIIETELPRLALGAPTLIATAARPESVPYQQAKTLRLQRQVQLSRMRMPLFRTIKRMSLYGLGPMMTWWNPDKAAFAVSDISWFDFFISPDASEWSEAECLWVRSWYTPRQLRRMADRVDSHGEKLYENLEEVIQASGEPDMTDPLWSQRREVHGEGPEAWTREGGLFPLYTGWYDDGSVIVLGGSDGRILVQARESPYRERIPHAARRKIPVTGDDGIIRMEVDPAGPTHRPMRPITCLTNTPDPAGSPYPIGSGDVVLTYQEELSTFRRQALDQATAHLNSPVVYDKAALGEDANAKIDAAFGQPGGKLAVNAGSNVNEVVARMKPGSLTMDVVGVSELLRSEAQLATGISDYVAGAASSAGMPSNQTATAVNRITDEANMRWRFKNVLVEEEMQVFASHVDAMDRQFGGVLMSDKNGSTRVAAGVEDHESLYELGLEANGDECDYDVKIEAGSLTPASQTQRVNDLMAYVNTAVAVPEMAAAVDWTEVIRNLTEALGFDPDRVLLSEKEVMAKAVAMNAAPGETPVGEPVAA